MRVTVFVALTVCALAVNATGQSAQKAVPAGVWGGKGIRLTVTATGATISYDCDAGVIDGPLLIEPSGKFLAKGTHTFGRGGPRPPGTVARRTHTARYQGVVDGNTMRLAVELPDLQRHLGDFTLELGRRATLERCG